jgi:hypothetical protein
MIISSSSENSQTELENIAFECSKRAFQELFKIPAPVHRGVSMFEVVQKSTRSPSSHAHKDSLCAHLSTQGLILGLICHTN